MRLAFVVDGFTDHAAVELRQSEKGTVRAKVHGGGDARAVKGQVKRILSLDHSGSEFAEVGERDPVIGRLQARFPGLRPVLFNSPDEAKFAKLAERWRPFRTWAMVLIRAAGDRCALTAR